jgi:hypothetical protein
MIGVDPLTGLPQFRPRPRVVGGGGSSNGGGSGQKWSVHKSSSTTANGTNTLFTVPETYAFGTLKVYLNGQLLRGGANDYSETSSTSFTFVSAPLSSDVIVLEYRTS